MHPAAVFRDASLAVAVGSTVVYWAAYLDNRNAMAERRAVLAATAMPIPLNGFRPNLRGVTSAAATGRPGIEVPDGTAPWLLLVVSDTCPGSAVAVPEWIDWIRSSTHRDYTAVVVSMAGTEHLTLIGDALASRGIEAVRLQVTQVHEFTRFSGVSVTPTLLGVDRQGHIRFAGGHLSPTTRRVLDEFFNTQNRSAAGE
jgi:hypothetical protein